MRRTLLAILSGALILTIPAAAQAAAATDARAVPATSEMTKADGAKSHPRRHGYGDRYHRPHPRYYDRGRYGRGYYGESRYQRGRCWREERQSYYRGRPALISVQLCRGRYGGVYVVEGSARLIRYVRHRRY